MKKTIIILLIFAVVLAGALCVAALTGGVMPSEEEQAAALAAEEEKTVVLNAFDEAGATAVQLTGGGVSSVGYGVSHAGGVVTIGYPGTYRVSGSLEGGQLVVDLGSFDGAVYLILDGVSISCDDGPAIYIKESDWTEIILAADTVNSLRDGADYMIDESTAFEQVEELKTGAGIFSADDLVIGGEGVLAVTGCSSDGIRSKDSLTITGGTLAVSAVDDGIQASDFIEITGGSVAVEAPGNGMKTTEGQILVSGGSVDIGSGGDGIDAVTTVDISGGSVTVTTYGGAENYAAAALAQISAKGIKAQDVTVTGGEVYLCTADDGIHSFGDISLSDAVFTAVCGDDAFSAAGAVQAAGCEFSVTQSYEVMQGESVSLSGCTLVAYADNNGIDAGLGGFAMEESLVYLCAPRAVSTEGAMTVDGRLYAEADGTDSLFKFASCRVDGTVIAFVPTYGAGQDVTLLEKGEIPGSLLFQMPSAVAV